MSKILDINLSLQIPNMVFKSDVDNTIQQITDKASGIPFVGVNSPIYNYDGRIDCQNGTKKYLKSNTKKALLPESGDFTILIKAHLPDLTANYINCSLLSNINEDQITSENPTGVNFLIRIGNTSGRNIQFTATENGVWSTNYAKDSIFNYPNPIDNIYNYVLCRKGNILQIITNGYLTITTMTENVGQEVSDILCGTSTYSTPLTANIYHAIVLDTALYDFTANSNGDFVLPNFTQDFTFFKRFQNKDETKKLFLTSNNLEGAVIDSANQISELVSEIDSSVLEVDPNAQPHKLTKYGFYSSGETSAYLPKIRFGSDFEIGIKDCYIGVWCNYISSGSVNSTVYKQIGASQQNFRLYLNTAGNIQYWFGGSVYNTGVSVYVNKWSYYSLLRKNGVIYFLINGVLIESHNNSTNLDLSTTLNAQLQLFNQSGIVSHEVYNDDFLYSVGDSIIDPTGYSVGDKVFESPRRKSFDDKFIQYPIP